MAARIGDGVFATARIPRGSIVWTQDALDQVIAPGDLDRLPNVLRAAIDRFAHVDERGNRILCWDAGRLVNHACTPNLRGIGARVMVASREIAAGEEITCDYAECNLDAPLACACRAPDCRRQIGRGDLERFADGWDAEAAGLLPLIPRVPQPLWPALLDPGEVTEMIEGRRALPSFRALYAASWCPR